MKKFLIAGFVVLIVIALIPYFYLNSLVKQAVENKGSAAIGAKVTLGSARISPFSGHGVLSGLKIANPAGFSSESAFSLQELDISLDMHSLMTDTVRISRVVVKAPEIIYEISPAGNNIYALYEKTRAGGNPGLDNHNGLQQRKKLIIDDLVIANGKVRMAANIPGMPNIPSVPGYKNATSFELPEIHLKDIGKNTGGVTAGELANIILDAVNKNLVAVNGLPLQGRFENLKGAVQGLFGR